MLGEGILFDVMRQGLWVAVMISTPILGVALATGLLVGLFQALTSVQEMTLTFVPKLGAMLIVFWMTMSNMSGSLQSYFNDVIIPRVIGI